MEFIGEFPAGKRFPAQCRTDITAQFLPVAVRTVNRLENFRHEQVERLKIRPYIHCGRHGRRIVFRCKTDDQQTHRIFLQKFAGSLFPGAEPEKGSFPENLILSVMTDDCPASDDQLQMLGIFRHNSRLDFRLICRVIQADRNETADSGIHKKLLIIFFARRLYFSSIAGTIIPDILFCKGEKI